MQYSSTSIHNKTTSKLEIEDSVIHLIKVIYEIKNTGLKY